MLVEVIQYASEEARRRGDDYISTEHLLLGLLRLPDDRSLNLLKEAGVSLVHARNCIEQCRASKTASTGKIDLTFRAIRVLELTYNQARHCQSNVVMPEHLLLGLLIEGEGLGFRILQESGISIEATQSLINTMKIQDKIAPSNN